MSSSKRGAPRSGLAVVIIAALLATIWAFLKAADYRGGDGLEDHFAWIIGAGVVVGLVIGLGAMVLGLILNRDVRWSTLAITIGLAIVVPSVPVIMNEVSNVGVDKITRMAVATYEAQDRTYDDKVRSLRFGDGLTARGIARDPQFKAAQAELDRARTVTAAYRKQVRDRRKVLIATFEERKISRRKREEYLKAFDAERATYDVEQELMWELEDSLLTEVDHAMEHLARTRAFWSVKGDAISFRREADFRAFDKYMSRIETIGHERDKVRRKVFLSGSRRS